MERNFQEKNPSFWTQHPKLLATDDVVGSVSISIRYILFQELKQDRKLCSKFTESCPKTKIAKCFLTMKGIQQVLCAGFLSVRMGPSGAGPGLVGVRG